MVVHLSFLVIGSRDQTNAKSAQTVRGPISRGLSLSLSFSPSRVRLGLSTSTPIEVEAYITRAAARGRGRAATTDIFGSFGWSLESRNEHKSILRHARKRVEDRTWAGFSPLFFSASASFVDGREREREGGW